MPPARTNPAPAARLAAGLLMAWVALVAGCASAPETPGPPPGPGLAPPPWLPAVVDLGPADDAEAWAPGDRVVLGLELTKPGSRLARFLSIELTDHLSQAGPTLQGTSKTMDGKATLIITSPVLATRLTVFDEAGRVIQETDGETARLFLSEGLGNVQDQAVRQLKGLTTIAPFPPREQDRIQLGYLSLLIANQSASSNPVMRDLVDEVIRRPSLLGLLFNRSITLASDDRSPSSATTWTPPGGTPIDAAVVPYSLSAGGSEVLLPTFTTIRIRPPLGLCGGIVAMDAVRPGDPGVRLTVRLVSATRGHGRKDPGWSAPSYFRVPIVPTEGDEPKGP